MYKAYKLNAGFSKVCEIFKVCGIESLKYIREFHTPVCYCGDISIRYLNMLLCYCKIVRLLLAYIEISPACSRRAVSQCSFNSR